jgi:hypothetical protein
MTFHAIFWLALAAFTLVGVPIILVWSMVSHLRGRGSERQGGGGLSAGVGAALQEIDRIMARPSVEHQIETEHKTLRREDDTGGD